MKKIITIILATIALLFFKNMPVKAQCGSGVCWPSNGGTANLISKCEDRGSGDCYSASSYSQSCTCSGSGCSCSIGPGTSCQWGGNIGGDVCSCLGGSNAGGVCSSSAGCPKPGGAYGGGGYSQCVCSPPASGGCYPVGTANISCCYGASVSNTPAPAATATPGGGGGPTSPPGASPTPTPLPYFSGNLYDDVNATPIGLGGTDSLCTGSTATLANGTGGAATISRAGESNSVSASFGYSLTTATTNSDYTVTLDLPFPPPDPSAAWQCACNADPSDPYRCLYTNQAPTSGSSFVNFFVYQANLNNTAWWQTLGGHVYSETNIETHIPTTTCLPPTCSAALIDSDIAGVQDSAGFPATNLGSVVTTIIGDTYIHEAADRSSSVQGKAQGVDLPIEDYSYFSGKLSGQAQTLSDANKPTPSSNPGVYLYTGDLTITEASPWNVSNSEQIIVLVSGNLIFDDTTTSEARLVTVAEGGTGFIQFIVSGNTTINSNVGYATITTDATQADTATLEGIYVSDGIFAIQGTAATTDRKFIGAGTFVGWSGVQLERNFDDGATPTFNNEDATETFIYRPDLMVNTPQILKSAHITWQEVAPQWPGL